VQRRDLRGLPDLRIESVLQQQRVRDARVPDVRQRQRVRQLQHDLYGHL
jgi:hypothetical protein